MPKPSVAASNAVQLSAGPQAAKAGSAMPMLPARKPQRRLPKPPSLKREAGTQQLPQAEAKRARQDAAPGMPDR